MVADQKMDGEVPHTALAGSQRELVGAHLLLLNRLLRRSARADFAFFEPRNQMERRVVLLLDRIGEGRVSQMADVLGNDIAQVSRALRALADCALVERAGPREPYQLSATGAELGRTLEVIALAREHELERGFDPHEMFELGGILSRMQASAGEELARELESPAASHAPPPDRAGARATRLSSIDFPGLVHPTIASLATMIMRSANIAYKRDTGLSSHEWRVLANVAGRPGVAFSDLVELIQSDKAQVHRSLESLVVSGVLSRDRSGHGQPVRYAMTQKGSAVHDVLLANARERGRRILADLNPRQRERLQDYFDRLIANAVSMSQRADAGLLPQ